MGGKPTGKEDYMVNSNDDIYNSFDAPNVKSTILEPTTTQRPLYPIIDVPIAVRCECYCGFRCDNIKEFRSHRCKGQERLVSRVQLLNSE